MPSLFPYRVISQEHLLLNAALFWVHFQGVQSKAVTQCPLPPFSDHCLPSYREGCYSLCVVAKVILKRANGLQNGLKEQIAMNDLVHVYLSGLIAYHFPQNIHPTL